MRKLWVFMLVLLVLSGLEGLSRGDEWGGDPGGAQTGNSVRHSAEQSFVN